MDEFIEVILFVITIVIFIVSAIRKQKKKPDGKKAGMQSVLESFLGVEKEQVLTADNYFDSESGRPVKESVEFQPSVSKDFNSEGIDSIPDSDDYEEEVSDTNSGFQFDLRSAVIYSEIMNRKY